MCDWLNINALFLSFYLFLFCLSSSLSDLLTGFPFLSFYHSVLTSFSLFLIIPPSLSLSFCSVPNLNSDLFDLQPAFIPAVQSTPSISTANSAWGGTLPTHIHTHIIHLHEYTHALIYIYEGSSRYTEMWRRHPPSNTQMNLSLKYSLWPVIHLSAHP